MNRHEDAAASAGNADLIRRLRSHAMDRSNGYTYLTADAAKALADADAEVARLRAALARVTGYEDSEIDALLVEYGRG